MSDKYPDSHGAVVQYDDTNRIVVITIPKSGWYMLNGNKAVYYNVGDQLTLNFDGFKEPNENKQRNS